MAHPLPPDPPEELAGFHRQTMMRAFGIAGVLLAVFAIASHREESLADDDVVQPWLHATFLIGVGVLMLYFLWRAQMAKPACPSCRTTMRETGKITVMKNPWRVFECEHCGKRYRIPSLL